MSAPAELHAFLLDLMPPLGRMVRERFDDPGRVTFKRPGQPVTEVDVAVEEEAVRRIQAAFPDHAVEGEESGGGPSAEVCTWHIDPIDGTMNFVRGIPFFSVSIGVSLAGRMLAGAVLDPLRDELFHARRGDGAWRNEGRIHVGPAVRLEDAAMSMQTSASGEYLRRPAFLLDAHRRLQKTRKLGSIALEMAYVACGRLDLLIAGKAKPQAWWDIAAGWILVEEAGGVVVTLDGGPVTRQSTHLVAGASGPVEGILRLFRESAPGD